MAREKRPARKKPPIRRRSDRGAQNDPDLATRADLARRRGVTKGAVTLACRRGGALFPAIEGRFVRLSHPATAAWLADGDATTAAESRELLVRKRSAEIERLETRNAKERGELIERSLVKNHLFGMVDATNRRLLGDTPKAIAKEVMPLAKSGASQEEIERRIRDHISSQLSEMKTAATRILRDEIEAEAKLESP